MSETDLVEDSTEASGGRRGIQSVGNAAKVLEALAQLSEASSLRVVSQASGLSTSQTHRYLASLIAAGMAQQDPISGRYDLGRGAIKLGLAALARTDVVRITEIAVSEFVRRSGRTVLICALGPLGPTVIRWYPGVPPVVTSLTLGSVLSTLHSATGNLFLAFASDSEMAPLIARELDSEASPVDLATLKQKVRAQGYANVTGTFVPDLRAAAFPIFDLQGRPALSATVVASAAMHTRNDAKVMAELSAVCAEISEQLGGRLSDL
jgi:DNA-binding IclR family transcriptional regulator